MVQKHLLVQIGVVILISALTASIVSVTLHQQPAAYRPAAAVVRIDTGLESAHSAAEYSNEEAAGRADYPWALQREDDLRPYQAGIDKDMVDRASLVEHAVRVAIRNQTIYIKTRNAPTSWLIDHISSSNALGMPHPALGYFVKVLCNHRVPDVDFAIVMGDREGASKADAPAPLFSWCKTAGQWDLLYPYWQHLLWDNLTVDMRVDWDKKEDKAFWRGSTTGAWFWSSKSTTRQMLFWGKARDVARVQEYHSINGRT